MRLLILASLTLTFVQSAAARPKLKCSRAENAITIDGVNKEWIGQLKVIKKTDLAVGVKRDQEFLYLAVLFSESPYQDQVLNQGMTVWFDPDGGKNETIGINFPSRSMGEPDFREPDNHEENESEPPEKPGRKNLDEAEYFLVLGPGKNQRTQMGFSEGEIIQVRAAENGQTMFYELRIPLEQSDAQPYGIGVKPGKKLGIGLKLADLDSMRGRERNLSRDRGGMGGGMPGGMGGGAPGGMGGGREGGGMGRPDSAKTLDVWIQVEDIEKSFP